MLKYIVAPLAPLLAAGCTPQIIPASPEPAERPLKIASWNVEFLAEKDGTGCEPPAPEDYAAMRRIADGLDADVIAFQEAEHVPAATRVFDPARSTIGMEARAGPLSGTSDGQHPQPHAIPQPVGSAVPPGTHLPA